jgi:hypothetical protein
MSQLDAPACSEKQTQISILALLLLLKVWLFKNTEIKN